MVLSARVAIAAAVAAAAGLVAACEASRPCAPRADHAVVACVGSAPVAAAEVAEHLRPAAPDPAAAVDAAVRVRLFADEAARRGLAADGPPARRRAALYQALIRDEAARAGAVVDRISDDEARRAYEAAPGRFNKVTGVELRAVIVADAADAADVARAAVGLDDAGFAALVLVRSHDPSAAGGGLVPDALAEGVDPGLRRAAVELRVEGALAGPIELGDGRFAVVRARRLALSVKPFDATVALTVKHALAREREQAALAALEARLRAERRVEVFADAVARVAPP